MPKRRSKSGANRNLRAVIDEQLTAAAHEIFLLLRECAHANVEQLRERVTERITAAVERIFSAFQASKAADSGAEEPGESPRAEPEPAGEVRVLIQSFPELILPAGDAVKASQSSQCSSSAPVSSGQE